MNQQTLQSIFGDDYPDGSTSFVSAPGCTTFCVGNAGALVDVCTSEEQERLLPMGTFGQDITE